MTLSSITHVAAMPAESRPVPGKWINAKQVQENAIITAVRRQIEALEDKMCGHVANEIARVQQHSDRMRDSAMARLDAKVAHMETAQLPRLDKRVAELSGNYKGLSEEMQSQIHRIDQMDTRLWEWRNQLDEETRNKVKEVEEMHQQLCTSSRVNKATNDDLLRRQMTRVTKLEELLEERSAHAEDLSHSLMNLHGRLIQVEDPKSPQQSHVMACRNLVTDLDESASVVLLEKQHSDVLSKFEQMRQDWGELRAQVESQEERYKLLRTLFDVKDEQYRSLGDRLDSENWEGRLKELQIRMHDAQQSNMGHSEQLEILHKKLYNQEQNQGQLGNHLRTLQEHASASMDSSQLAKTFETDLYVERLSHAEARVSALVDDVEVIRTDLELAPRVAALISMLKDVAPKLVAQEDATVELKHKLDQLSARVGQIQEHGTFQTVSA